MKAPPASGLRQHTTGVVTGLGPLSRAPGAQRQRETKFADERQRELAEDSRLLSRVDGPTQYRDHTRGAAMTAQTLAQAKMKKELPLASRLAHWQAEHAALEAEASAFRARESHLDTLLAIGSGSWGEQVTCAPGAREALDGDRPFTVRVAGPVPLSRAAPAVLAAGYTQTTVPPYRADLWPELLSLIPRATTSQGTVPYGVRITQELNADVVPEGGLKPFSILTWEPRIGHLQAVATALAISRQATVAMRALELGQFIDTQLVSAVRRRLEEVVVQGFGTTPGLLTDAQEAASIPAAVAAIQSADHRADAIVVNPLDALTLLAVPALARAAQPEGAGILPYARIVTSPAIPAGTALVGDFETGCQLWESGGAEISVADEHEDWRVRNMRLLLCELFALLTVYSPAAFCVVELAPQPEEPPEEQSA